MVSIDFSRKRGGVRVSKMIKLARSDSVGECDLYEKWGGFLDNDMVFRLISVRSSHWRGIASSLVQGGIVTLIEDFLRLGGRLNILRSRNRPMCLSSGVNSYAAFCATLGRIQRSILS